LAKVFVITGPSGVGKGTLIRTLLERVPELELSTSATTRRPRPGETQGVDYHFLSDEEFARRVEAGEFVEWAEYSGRRYGTLRSELESRLAGGHPVVLEIEVPGARQIRESLPAAV
jgi:guanylate kinase